MNILLNQAAMMAILIAICWVGPLTAVVFLRLRKRRARAARRSPLKENLLREPGHTLRARLEELRSDVHGSIYEATAVPLILAVTAFGQAQVVSAATLKMAVPVYVAMGISALGYLGVKLWKDGATLDDLRTGYDAEVAVGQELNRLMLQGAAVFHDVPGDNFNIDHVVVCTADVFAVETKGRTKRNGKGGTAEATVEYDGVSLKFPTYTTREPIEQSSRQAAWLSRWLTSAVGSPVRAQAVVALPGWFVRRTGRGGVWVYSGKELVGLPRAYGAQQLASRDVQRVAHQLEQRCRTVAPMLVDVEKVI